MDTNLAMDTSGSSEARLGAVPLQGGHIRGALIRHAQRPPVAALGLLALGDELPQGHTVGERVRLSQHQMGICSAMQWEGQAAIRLIQPTVTRQLLGDECAGTGLIVSIPASTAETVSDTVFIDRKF